MLYVFDKTKRSPVYYRLLPGNIPDTSAFVNTLRESGIKNCTVVADKGFYSKVNTSALDEMQISYILPLKGNTKYMGDEFLSKTGTDKYDDCFVYHDRVIWHKKKAVGTSGKFIYIFQDDGVRKSSELNYIKRKTANYEDYTLEGFYEHQKTFGMHFFYSNLDITPQDAYLTYKTRWEIEECFDYLKNALDLGAVYQHSNEK